MQNREFFYPAIRAILASCWNANKDAITEDPGELRMRYIVMGTIGEENAERPKGRRVEKLSYPCRSDHGSLFFNFKRRLIRVKIDVCGESGLRERRRDLANA